ncbi:MAG TPA: FAD-binding protein, partial [Candidatus Eisenbacteria bacterium]|nr:FAD-binding protein [Candidatus Eisenbacteria bacterium]
MSWITERAMPSTAVELSSLLAGRREGPRWMAKGGGTLLGRGALPPEPVALVDLSGCRSVVEHAYDDLTVTVETGMPMGELRHRLEEQNQWLPLSL